MSLQEKLNEHKAKFVSNAPKEITEIMHRATDDLRNSGIVERALNVGDRAPDFSLKNAEGVVIHSQDLLAKGPIVLSFFRGKW